MAARVKKRADTATNRESDKIITRLPEGMRPNLAKLADQRGRSVNAEVVRALTQYLQLELGVKPEAARTGDGYLLSEHGLYIISKRLEASVGALEELFFNVRDRRPGAAPELTPSDSDWKGLLRLALVTCPVALIPATAPEMNHHAAHTKDDGIDSGPGSTNTIEIGEFVPRGEIDPRYVIRPYYLRPDGKVGHDAFAVIRETIREMNKVAIGRVVLMNREHIIALNPLDKGLVGTLLRHPHELRSANEYFDEIQDVKITREMLDLAKHIVEQRSGHFEPGKFESQAKSVPTKPHSEDQNLKAVTLGSNVINLMDALKTSLAKDKGAEKIAATKQ